MSRQLLKLSASKCHYDKKKLFSDEVAVLLGYCDICAETKYLGKLTYTFSANANVLSVSTA
jgi:hypothetical protein